MSINKLLNWCKKKHIAVKFGPTLATMYDFNKRTICINSNLRPQRMLHSFLHECGHFLLDSSRVKLYKHGYDGAPPRRAKKVEKVRHCSDTICEECEAWARGERLAKRLGIPLDHDSFSKQRSESLTTYYEWAARVKKSHWMEPI